MAYVSVKPYKPSAPFSVPFKIGTPTNETLKGVPTKTYTESEPVYFGNLRTFLGTESVKDGLYSVIDTATLETWYTPELKADCRVHLLESDEFTFPRFPFPNSDAAADGTTPSGAHNTR